MTIQMKATEQYFHVVLFIMLYKVVLTFKFVNEIKVCDHSSKSCRAVLPCVTKEDLNICLLYFDNS